MNNTMNLTVIDGLSVAVIPNAEHEFLMTTKEVAQGYGVTDYAIRQTQFRNNADFVEGKHFVKGITICNTLANAQPHRN